MDCQFKVGDVVILKTRIPPIMTIESIHVNNEGKYCGVCVWIVNNKKYEEEFLLSSLDIYERAVAV